MAELAAVIYVDHGGWSAKARTSLMHLSQLDGLQIRVRSDETQFGSRLTELETGTAPVMVRGQQIATITVAQKGAALLTPEESQLRSSINRLHLVAGAISAIAALALAFLLAETLSRPLRRIRAAAARIAEGDLATRVTGLGDREVRAVGQALNTLAQTLEHEEQMRKQTVADLAHELRTPVNGMLTRIEAAQDGVLTGPENLDAMHEEALRLTRLLDDLARLADAEQPGLLLEKDIVDVGAVADAAARSLAPQYAEAGITLQSQLTRVTVLGDVARLSQVVTNLLTNALRYTPRGGTVTLRVRSSADKAIVEVEDTGIGIRPDDLPHLFTRFWRGDPSRSPATGGTGVGLAIVRELVRAHDGQVEAESTFGAGSVFRVTLPAAAAAAGQLKPQPRTGPPMPV
jgi:two-component system sensor histidine kinase BaeS